MAEFASKGVAGAGLGLGIAGTALGVMNGGLGNILGGVFGPRQVVTDPVYGGWGGCCSENQLVNRYEAGKDARIAELETEVKLRDANTYTLGEVNKVRDYMERRFDHIEHELCDQKVYNATNTAAISCIQNQVNQLAGLTKVVIPAASICPEVMPRYNSWTAPTEPAGT